MTERYQITSQLGEDILGAVYLADDTMLQRRVMCRYIEYGDNPEVKTRDDSWRRDFGIYTGKMGSMQHPNMMTIYDVHIADGGAYVFSQLIEGESLAERLQTGALSEAGVYRMAADMLEALHAAHESGVFHGALHTGSIKRINRASGGHRYLLVDLGLNQLASMVKAEKVKVADPVILAPELHQEGVEPDARADLFMLGQLCYTALVGGHPFSSKSSEECLAAYHGEGIPSVDQYVDKLKPDFVKWIMSLIDVDPEKRPQDVSAAMITLHAFELADAAAKKLEQTARISEAAAGMAVAQGGAAMATSAVNNSAANTAAGDPLSGAHAQVVNDVAKSAKKEKVLMFSIIGGLVMFLILGVIFATKRGDSSESDGASVVKDTSGLHSLSIGKEVFIHSLRKQNNPKTVTLDSSDTVDWMVGVDIPISSKLVTGGGGYILSIQTFGQVSPVKMTENPIRFTKNEKVLFPGASVVRNNEQSEDAGYEIQLRMPRKDPSSVTVNLYLIQNAGDYRIEVLSSKDESMTDSEILADEPGAIQVPVIINNPVAGGFYTIRVITGPVKGSEAIQSALSGLIISKH